MEKENQYPRTLKVGDTTYIVNNLAEELRVIKMIKTKEGQMQA